MPALQIAMQNSSEGVLWMMISDVTAWPESRRPAQAEPWKARLHEALGGLPVAHSSGFKNLKL